MYCRRLWGGVTNMKMPLGHEREPGVLAHVLAPGRGRAGWCEVSRSEAVCVRLSVPGGSCLASGG